MSVLVTGGCGYIGSHVVLELLLRNYDVIVVDNCINSYKSVINKLENFTEKKIKFYKFNLLDKDNLECIFKQNKINSIIHLAALKSVGQSVTDPYLYYNNNIVSLLNVLYCMKKYNCNDLIYSSSACVYGEPKYLPIDEKHETFPINPYGQTKIMSEKILEDYYNANKQCNITILRYFNPIGCHKSKVILENPKSNVNNIIPTLLSCIKNNKVFTIFGNDYNTKDGTCVRDYIHVVDLAVGHVKALVRIKNSKYQIYNLGTGNGYTVLEIINTFNKFSNDKVKYVFGNKRNGDSESCYSDNTKALKFLNWKCKYNLSDMIKSCL